MTSPRSPLSSGHWLRTGLGLTLEVQVQRVVQGRGDVELVLLAELLKERLRHPVTKQNASRSLRLVICEQTAKGLYLASFGLETQAGPRLVGLLPPPPVTAAVSRGTCSGSSYVHSV